MAAALSDLNCQVKKIELGKAVFVCNADLLEEQLSAALSVLGFEVIRSEEERLTDDIKTVIRQIMLSDPDTDSKGIRSRLEKLTLRPFRILNRIFSKATRMSINKYTTLQRLEKVKVMIREGRRNFSEIAYITGYKTTQHLAAQFRRYEGITMGDFQLAAAKDAGGGSPRM